jgi:hypothetical protein
MTFFCPQDADDAAILPGQRAADEILSAAS